MFDWNPRRVSSLLAVLCVWPLLAAAQPRLEFPPDGPADTAARSWLEEDQAWLAARTPAVWTLDGLFDLLDTAEGDSLRLRALADLTAGLSVTTSDTVVVRAPLDELRARWLERGYLGVRVQAAGRDSLTAAPLIVSLIPGPRYTWGDLRVGGPEFSGRDRLLATWLPRPGEDLEAAKLEMAIDRVLTGAGEAGYPFARWVTGQLELDPAAATVSLRATLLPGQLAYIGPVTTSLENPRARSFLARSSGLREGAMFRNSDLNRAADRLLARDLYAQVDPPRVYLTTSADTVGVFFPVTPRRKVNRLQVVLGLSRDPETGDSSLSGEVDLSLPDLAGSGRGLRVGWRDDGLQKRRFGLTYVEPLAFGTPLDTDFTLDNEVETDSYTRFRLENRWRLPVVAYWGVELGVGWDRSTYPTGSLERTSRLRGRAAILHRRGDRSTSGWEGIFAIETASRKSTARPDTLDTGVSGAQLGEAVTQRILEGDLAAEQWLGGTFSLAGRVAFRQLTGGTDDVPLSEQFRFGGAATLRGYREDEFNGTTVSYGSLEARIGRPGASRLYTFYDLGYFEFSALDPTDLDPARRSLRRGWPRGFGLGLLARSPAGDLSLAVGFPGTVDFDQAKLHVILLESF